MAHSIREAPTGLTLR